MDYINKLLRNDTIEANIKIKELMNNDLIKEKIDNIFEWNKREYGDVYLSESIWKDCSLSKWCESSCELMGSKKLLENILKNPTSNTELLKERQKIIFSAKKNKLVNELKQYESDVLWLFTLPKLKDAWPFNLLFPSVPIINFINYSPEILQCYHIFRCYISPAMSFITPMFALISPWYYLNKQLKLNITLKTYIKFLLMAFKEGLKSSGFNNVNNIKYISVFLYIFFYVYNVFQSFELSNLLRRVYHNLNSRMESIRKFVDLSEKIISQDKIKYEDTLFMQRKYDKKKVIIQPGLSGFYQILHCDKIKERILSLIEYIYTIDICQFIRKQKFSYVFYRNETRLWNMGHVLLDKDQIRNPLCMKKNLIVTGPNAAGKTTYIKSFAINVILGQTIGFNYSDKCILEPFHAIGSFMRISDEIGQSSLYEAEVQRCKELIEQAENISNIGKKAIFFLDEPMHSTPPLEGTATSLAVAEYLSKIKGIKLVMTTHYHELTTLESRNPDTFLNVSMEAIPSNDGHIFPYKIRKGSSFQSIAIELLNSKQLPFEIIECAINVKNELIAKHVRL